MNKRHILVTSALPYANGPLHLGHLVEYIQTDIWVRYQKMQGSQCIYICADDAHGTGISLHAEKNNITPETLIQKIHKERIKDFKDFFIEFDNYHTTHSEENLRLSYSIYNKLKQGKYFEKKIITQAYDPAKNIFLADRYIKGDCPKCGANDQYGDNCEKCCATYSPNDLKNAYSVLSGVTPIKKDSEHIFFKLSQFTNFLKKWKNSGTVSNEISNKLNEWLDTGLQDWDISRDAPYFGFEIPDEKNKYFYVWLDAPIGYLASFEALCNKTPELDFDSFWDENSKYEVHHFIGKDIVNFHCLFWPAMLKGSQYRTPTSIRVHGYLTINGEKMSKSRGTFISARTYLDYLDPEYLRYYFAYKLSNGIDDIDFNTEDFVQRVNSDLIGKLVNIASRCASFIHKRFDGYLAKNNNIPNLINEFQQSSNIIAQYYETNQYSKAMKIIMTLADKANAWINGKQPWVVANNLEQSDSLQEICSIGINLFRILTIYIKPVLPHLSKKIENFLNIEPLVWKDSQNLLFSHRINIFKPIMTRIEPKKIDHVLNASKDSILPSSKGKTDNKSSPWRKTDPISDTINFEEFSKVDLRVAKIIDASLIDGSKKLLKLVIDIGEAKNRVIFAGLKSAYTPEELKGKYTVVVANLAPRKMKFGTSNGMILAAGPGGKELTILSLHSKAQPGMRIM